MVRPPARYAASSGSATRLVQQDHDRRQERRIQRRLEGECEQLDLHRRESRG